MEGELGELITLLREGGPLAVVSVVAIYVLVRDRRNNRRPSNPGNPGPALTNGRWQQEMRDAQRETNAKLGRIERVLMLMLGRMGVDPPSE